MSEVELKEAKSLEVIKVVPSLQLMILNPTLLNTLASKENITVMSYEEEEAQQNALVVKGWVTVGERTLRGVGEIEDDALLGAREALVQLPVVFLTPTRPPVAFVEKQDLMEKSASVAVSPPR